MNEISLHELYRIGIDKDKAIRMINALGIKAKGNMKQIRHIAMRRGEPTECFAQIRVFTLEETKRVVDDMLLSPYVNKSTCSTWNDFKTILESFHNI
jgi:hypothetical protein